jgi:hypothetical protein
MSLLPPLALAEVARVVTQAADSGKYSDHDWLDNPRAWTIELDAAIRHLNAFAAGVDIDSESRQPHVAHAIARLLHLLHYQLTSMGVDDRWKGELCGEERSGEDLQLMHCSRCAQHKPPFYEGVGGKWYCGECWVAPQIYPRARFTRHDDGAMST